MFDTETLQPVDSEYLRYCHDMEEPGGGTGTEHVSELSKADLIVLLQDMWAADITLDMEVIAACQKWGIYP